MSTHMTNTVANTTINISASDALLQEHPTAIDANYNKTTLKQVLEMSLSYMDKLISDEMLETYPNFSDIDWALWLAKPKELDIYLTNLAEGRTLNNEARGKDYATNILSYPSELPPFVIDEMPTLPLGELIICHEVIFNEAQAQYKPLSDHITHLIVHGVLHLLGFDHELGQDEQNEMEAFEVAILAKLGIANPYETRIKPE